MTLDCTELRHQIQDKTTSKIRNLLQKCSFPHITLGHSAPLKHQGKHVVWMFHAATGIGEKKKITLLNLNIILWWTSLTKLTQLCLVRHWIAYTVSDRPSRKSTLSPRRPQTGRAGTCVLLMLLYFHKHQLQTNNRICLISMSRMGKRKVFQEHWKTRT